MTTSSKYGVEFTEQQVEDQKAFLHHEIHKLLYSKEEGDPKLNVYFDKTIRLIAGMNELLSYPAELITLISLLQMGKAEANKPDYDHQVYRTIIFDSHSCLDRLFRGVDDAHVSG